MAEEASEKTPEVVLVARTSRIDDLVQACARKQITFDFLCKEISSMGYSIGSLYWMVCAAEEAGAALRG